MSRLKPSITARMYRNMNKSIRNPPEKTIREQEVATIREAEVEEVVGSLVRINSRNSNNIMIINMMNIMMMKNSMVTLKILITNRITTRAMKVQEAEEVAEVVDKLEEEGKGKEVAEEAIKGEVLSRSPLFLEEDKTSMEHKTIREEVLLHADKEDNIRTSTDY